MAPASACETAIPRGLIKDAQYVEILCRRASLERKMCKRLALLIALCLLFSLIPVADSQLKPKDSKDDNAIRLRSIPDAQVPTSRKLFQTFSQPDQYEVSEVDFVDMISIKQIPAAGLSDVNGAANSDREEGASPTRDLLADATRPLDYQMESVKNAHVLSSQRYVKVNGLQLIEEIEGERRRGNDQNVVSHGLIRVKPIEWKESINELYLQDHQMRALAEMAASQGPAGMLWTKADTNEVSKEGLSKLSASSQFGLGGLTREQEQIHNVVAALRRAGLFGAIAGTIEGMNLFMLPQFVTIFVPTDAAYRGIKQEDLNFQLFQYHIVMQRYAFIQLCRLREGDVLYTLLPGYSIIVTGEQSPFKFSLDGTSVIAPDLYVDQSIAVHGIDGVFNCTMYGKKIGGWRVPEAAPLPPNVSISPPVQGTNPSSINGSVAGANNVSVAGSGEAGQRGPDQQQNAGTIPILTPPTNVFPFSFSPQGSVLASDTDASDDTISAKIGACAAATAFVCVLSVLCS